MDEKDDEKESNVVPLRLFMGGGGGSLPDNVLAAKMLDARRRDQMMRALQAFYDLASSGKLETLCIIAREKKPPIASGSAINAIVPTDYNSFEVQGMLNATLHFEVQKLRVERPDPTEPPKGGA